MKNSIQLTSLAQHSQTVAKMKRSPCIFLASAFLWLNVPEISGHAMTISDRARTMRVTTSWVQEQYGKKYILSRLDSQRAEKVPAGLNFYVVALFKQNFCYNKRLMCKATLQRPKQRTRLVRVNLECNKVGFRYCKMKGGCVPKGCLNDYY